MSPRHILLVAASSVAIVAAQPLLPPAIQPAPAPTHKWVRSEVFFGMSIPGGGRVSESEWTDFLNCSVTPRFPNGLSVMESAGQWQNRAGEIDTEPSKVLVIVHQPTLRTRAAINELRRLWCKLHQQESVMAVTSPASVDF